MVNVTESDTVKEEEPFGLGCALEYFTDYDEVAKTIQNLPVLVGAERSVQEKSLERFTFILSQYIEQPHLLDSHIEKLLEKFVDTIRNPESSSALKHLTFSYMFVLVNVRGYKEIVRQLPHEVADFEAVLQLLEAQDPNDSNTWTTRYILLLWLSIIVMIPFDLSRFDDTESDKLTVMERVLNQIKTYAVVPDKCRDAAAFLSFKFITRNDVKILHLKTFFDWAMLESLAPTSNVFVKYGTLACIAAIIKHGKRNDILPHARRLLDWIINSEFKENSGSNVLKMVYKIIQRIGLTFLPPRVATWRYQRGNRSLATNLSAGGDTNSSSTPVNCSPDTCEDEESIEVPDEVEEVIDQLIQGLRCPDSVVRWSAAKGIGRVTWRLPKDLGDDVVGSVLELLGPRENDASWHGGCIALAELGRRGLLLPDRLPHVVPVILKALVYDEPRGYSSVGSHIRDAACYVCWSFARAYEPNDLAPYVQDIASTLLVVTCFDKEINCRRAASAAFQENVGRQGTFPHGIDILTAADFFAVSVRNNSYLNISVHIAQFEEYTIPLIDHLVARKMDHWDISIRELTAKALHSLTPKDPQYMVTSVLPTLFEKTDSIDLNCRHGAVLAIGQILYALSLLNGHPEAKITEDILEKVKRVVPKFTEKLYFRGLGGELMKQACSDFIEKCSLAKLPLQNEKVLGDWLTLLNDILSYEVYNVRMAAVSALPAFLNEYYCTEEKREFNKKLIENYVQEMLGDTKQSARMGHALALGSLPKFLLQPNFDLIVNSLMEACQITTQTCKWAEPRRDAVKALTSVSSTMIKEIGKEFREETIKKIYTTFFEGLKDYTQDKRGDIGAWVREASVNGLQILTLLLTECHPEILTSDLMNQVLSSIAQQALEKIDRTRAIAGKVFYSFIYNNPRVPNIEHYDEISLIFPKEECDILNWNSANATFPKFVQLVQFEPYTYNVLVGLICSVGGMTESLVKNAGSSFFSYLRERLKLNGEADIIRICDILCQILEDYKKNDRITVPLFRFLDQLFDSGCIECMIDNDNPTWAKKVLKLVQMEISGCKDVYKLVDGINALCQFVQVRGDVCDTALVQLSILLCHRQAYVRRSTSSKLYESLLVNGDSSNISPEKLNEVMQVLSSTNWEEPVDVIKPVRNQLCGLMGVRVPVPAKRSA